MTTFSFSTDRTGNGGGATVHGSQSRPTWQSPMTVDYCMVGDW